MLLTILLFRKETKVPVPLCGPTVPLPLAETSVSNLLPETSFDVDFRAACIPLCSGEGPTKDFSVLPKFDVPGGKTAFAQPGK